MKSIALLLILVFISACSSDKKGESKVDAEKGSSANQSFKELSQDSLLYIDKTYYFPETNEFYIHIGSKIPISTEQFFALRDKADSVIYEDEENGRYRLPSYIVEQYFDLSHKDSLITFNSNHKHIASLKFKRVEYLSANISDALIAVFTPDRPVPHDELDFYSLGNAQVNFRQISTSEITDSTLTERIKNELSINPQYIWQVKHFEIKPENTIFSIIAFDGRDGKTYSYLTELKENKLSVLSKLNEQYIFFDILPLPIERNKKPVLLINIVVPESDAVDDYILSVFDKKEYQLLKDNKLKLAIEGVSN